MVMVGNEIFGLALRLLDLRFFALGRASSFLGSFFNIFHTYIHIIHSTIVPNIQ